MPLPILINRNYFASIPNIFKIFLKKAISKIKKIGFFKLLYGNPGKENFKIFSNTFVDKTSNFNMLFTALLYHSPIQNYPTLKLGVALKQRRYEMG